MSANSDDLNCTVFSTKLWNPMHVWDSCEPAAKWYAERVWLIPCCLCSHLLPTSDSLRDLNSKTYPTEWLQPTLSHWGKDWLSTLQQHINSEMSNSKVTKAPNYWRSVCLRRMNHSLLSSAVLICFFSTLPLLTGASDRSRIYIWFIVLYGTLCLNDCIITILPVPIIQLNLHSQLLQGDVGVAPEGNLHHLPDQLVQLALQLLDDGQVVCVLRILALKL